MAGEDETSEKPEDGGAREEAAEPAEKKDEEKAEDAEKDAEKASPAPAPAAAGKAAWGAPLDRLDRVWTKLEAWLCAGVLVTMIVTLVFWIALKALASTGKDGAGQLFRSMLTALVLGLVGHFATRKRRDEGPLHPVVTTAAVVIGWIAGKYWGDAGTEYFSNLEAWIQNASIWVFFGGIGELAKCLTLWVALLGASLATAQGKHINVDVVMRFLSPRMRVPVAVLGWLMAAVVSGAAAWGFFDDLVVEELDAPASVPCPGDATKSCPATAGSKIHHVIDDTGRDLFLAGRQLSLDTRSFPKVLGGTPYAKILTPKEWNEWLRAGGWEEHFKAEDVKALELPEDGSIDFRTPAVTAVPGATERIHMLLVPLLNMVFPFGLLVIAIRFVLRSLLALGGWVSVDPAAAHGGDQELAEVVDAQKEAAR